MQDTTLNKILKDKHSWIACKKKEKPLMSFQDRITDKTRNFYQFLKNKNPCFILECKKSSPSLGIIRHHFDLIYIAKIYKKYASCISVLTDTKYFHGDFKFIKIVRDCVIQPILCKDFFIDPYQVYLARYYHADAILLMLSVLSNKQYVTLSTLAQKLHMGILTEVNNVTELERAIYLKAEVIGINNRNLHDLSIDLNRTRNLASLINKNTLTISESGIQKYHHIKKLHSHVNGFLIGSHLMSKKNIDLEIRALIRGHNKVCGLTLKTDVKMIEKEGAVYGGLIFIQHSPRNITECIAKNIIKDSNLKFVGVFQNEIIDKIVSLSIELSLYAVQLHGYENQDYINILRKKLPKEIKIWKAITINAIFPKLNWKHVDTYLFDSSSGGSNTSFNWTVLHGKNLNNVILAGGINPHNCLEALKFNCKGLDLNSGIEKSPGVKDHKKIKLIFKKLRDFK